MQILIQFIDFINKKAKSDAHLLLLPLVTMDFINKKEKSNAHLLLLSLQTCISIII